MMPKCSARKPSRADAGSLVMSVPRMSISPICGATMPQIRLRNVDFPLPDGPIRRMRLAVGSEKASTAMEKASRPGQTKRTPDIRMTCGVSARDLAVATIVGSDHAGEAEDGIRACDLVLVLA